MKNFYHSSQGVNVHPPFSLLFFLFLWCREHVWMDFQRGMSFMELNIYIYISTVLPINLGVKVIYVG